MLANTRTKVCSPESSRLQKNREPDVLAMCFYPSAGEAEAERSLGSLSGQSNSKL